MSAQLIEISQGNSRILKFGPVLDPVTKVAVDLTGAHATWRLARSPSSPPTEIFLKKTDLDVTNPITFTSAVVSTVTQWFVWVRLMSSDTTLIPPSINPARYWWHELMLTDQFGNVDTAYRGGIILQPSIDIS